MSSGFYSTSSSSTEDSSSTTSSLTRSRAHSLPLGWWIQLAVALAMSATLIFISLKFGGV